MSLKFMFLIVATVLCAHVSGDVCTDPNASDQICGELCAASCDDLNPVFCPAVQCVWGLTSGCACNPGYVRNRGIGPACVRPEDCPK